MDDVFESDKKRQGFTLISQLLSLSRINKQLIILLVSILLASFK